MRQNTVLLIVGLAVAFVALSFWACAPSVQTTGLGEMNSPTTPADSSIRIYTGDLPRCPYDEIGPTSIRLRSDLYKPDVMARMLRQRVRAAGGDAVIGVQQREVVADAGVRKGKAFTTRAVVASGTVIRFRDGRCRD